MRRIGLLAFCTLFLAVVLSPGCSKQSHDADTKSGPIKPDVLVVADPKQKDKILQVGKNEPIKLPQDLGAKDLTPSEQDKYDAALADGLRLLTERKLAEALAAFEAANGFKETASLKIEIAQLRERIDQQNAADKTVQDIQAVLDQGDAAQAAALATAALQQYGGTDAAPQIIRLKLQADTLVASLLKNDQEKFARFRAEATAALLDKEKNYRAAVSALEQALQFGKDDELKEQYETLRDKLQRYDEKRQQAGELRKDPSRLEDAQALLQEAAKEWDTLQVRQEIDEISLALQNRRERLTVADFEVRGEVGIPVAGRTVADELLPLFKSRYDLVERGQLAKVVEELKLQDGQVGGDGEQQKEVGRIAKVRYLVVGSITPLGGITISARIVDVKTGLIVQTARVVAPTPEEAMNALPELAKLLLMSDDERIAYAQEQAKKPPVDPPAPIDVNAELPPQPEPPREDQPLPPPQILNEERAPDLGGVQVKDFQEIQPPPVDQPPPIAPGGKEEVLVKRKLLFVSLNLGDNLFRRGRFVEAHRHFDFALRLDPGNVALRLRVERCIPYLPPPVVVVVDPPPPMPRVAFVDFVVIGDPAVVPPGLSVWTPQNLAPYFSPPFEVVDRGELFYYMGRAGITVRDLINDSYARRWLGRALNVRYFVLGTIQQTNSFAVNTYLLDAEYGYQRGGAVLQVRDPYELKLRLAELAKMTLMSPEERLAYLNQAKEYNDLLLQAQTQREAGKFQLSINIYRNALKLRPGSIQINVLIQRDDAQARRAALEAARRAEWERQQAEAAECQRRQLELARQAEAARILAAQREAALSAQERALWEQKRLQAHEQAHERLVVQAQFALKAKNFTLSVQLYEGALNLRRDDKVYRELAEARLAGQRAAEARADQEREARLEAERKLREAEAKLARERLEQDRLARIRAEEARHKEQQKFDQLAYQRNFDEGQRLLNQDKFDGAIAAFQAARQVKKTDAADAMLTQALVAQAKAKGDAAGQKLVEQLAQEKARREIAEKAAQDNQKLYVQALEAAQTALAAKNYAKAVNHYQAAGKFYKTDAVLTGLRQAQAAQDQAAAQTKAAEQAAIAKAQLAADLKQSLMVGQFALEAKDYGKAVTAFAQAKKLSPDSIDALTGLSKAEQLRDQALAAARLKGVAQERQKNFQRLLESAQANYANKHFDVAVVSATEALKLNPGDPTALKLRDAADKAQKQLGLDAAKLAESKKRTDAYQKAMSDGRLALGGKQYDLAHKHFTTALQALPGDKAAQDFALEAKKAKDTGVATAQAEAKKRADEAQRQANVKQALTEARTALAAKNLKGAATAIAAAAKLAPQDADVLQAQRDLARAEQAAQAEATAQNLRQQQFQTMMKAGQDAYAAKKYGEALKHYNDARALLPNNPAILPLIAQAQKGFADDKTNQEAIAKKAAEAKKLDDFNTLLKRGQKAMTDKKYAEAVQSFTAARLLFPTDPNVTPLLTAAQKAVTDDKVGQDVLAKQKAAEAKKLDDFNTLMQRGQKAMLDKKYGDAVLSFNAAKLLFPTNPTAQTQLAAAQKAVNDDKVGQDVIAKQKAAEAKKLADFDTYVKQGQAAMTAKKYTDAVSWFGAAVKLYPTNPQAAQALRDAQQALTPVGPTPQVLAAFNKKMQDALALEKQQKWTDALKLYQEAVTLIPTSMPAKDKYRFTTHLTEGQKHLMAGRFVEAQREFENALTIFATNPEAQAGLKKAKAKMK